MTRISRHLGRISISTLAAAMILIAEGGPAAAQRGQAPTAQRGPWTGAPPPRWLPYYASEIGNVTAVQQAAAVRVLKEIERILLQVPQLADPKGFDIMPQYWGGGGMRGPDGMGIANSVVQYALRLYLFAPSQAIAGEGCVCISITVNASVAGESDEHGRAIYVETWQRGNPVPLATQVYGELLPRHDQALDEFSSSWITVIMTSGGEPYFKAVTRDEYYQFRIFQTEGKGGATLSEARKSQEKTTYQDWMAGVEARQKNREASLQSAARTQPPAEVARLRKTLEDAEREATAGLKAAEADELASKNEGVQQFAAVVDAMRNEWRSMTPAQRNMPAIVDPRGQPSAVGAAMADRDGPTMRRVLTPIPDFWRVRKSPVEVRSITVYIGGSTGVNERDSETVHTVLLQTLKKLDWAALNRLLDVPD